jgi:L,D-transpeptidase ErfK/SrfK
MLRTVVFFLLSLAVDAAQALTFRMPPEGEDVIGEVFKIKTERYEDTMNVYAERYGMGFREMLLANPGINPWVPGVDRTLVVPAEFILPPGERKGIVINLAEQRMYWYQPDGETVVTYPLGIGREGWETPLVNAKVIKSIKNPTWHPPASIRAEHAAMGDPLPLSVPPGPDNPMGKWAVQLSAIGYYIHGSNKELGVGMRVSHGCMRMYNRDIEEFAKTVPPGTPLRIINRPVKVGWKTGVMYVEVHEALEEQSSTHVPEAAVADAIHLQRLLKPADIDWIEAKAAAVQVSGMPVKVSAARVASR